jgi:hypothetical protein
MDHRRTPLAKQPPLMLDPEAVLGTTVIGVETFGMDVQTAVQLIDPGLRKLHVAQADQTPRPHFFDAARTRQQRAMNGHRLGTVLGRHMQPASGIR